jgi:hypothetical protein
MDNKEKKNSEKMFQEGDIPFPFKKFEKMAEMMRNCCTGEGGIANCCSMMKKMMGQEKRDEKKKQRGRQKRDRNIGSS